MAFRLTGLLYYKLAANLIACQSDDLPTFLPAYLLFLDKNHLLSFLNK